MYIFVEQQNHWFFFVYNYLLNAVSFHNINIQGTTNWFITHKRFQIRFNKLEKIFHNIDRKLFSPSYFLSFICCIYPFQDPFAYKNIIIILVLKEKFEQKIHFIAMHFVHFVYLVYKKYVNERCSVNSVKVKNQSCNKLLWWPNS